MTALEADVGMEGFEADWRLEIFADSGIRIGL